LLKKAFRGANKGSTRRKLIMSVERIAIIAEEGAVGIDITGEEYAHRKEYVHHLREKIWSQGHLSWRGKSSFHPYL